MVDDEELSYVRLHITPLDQSLLTAILPPSILPKARNISYHDIQTFPERPFGYVELPTVDAEKIKKRLHGSILKGTKVKIEAARPKDEMKEKDREAPKSKKDKSKKRKSDEISAVEIGERQVKRGWTVPAISSEKKKEKQAAVKSKYSSRPECLFKTVLPENIVETPKDAKPVKNKDKKGRQAVVHEFAKTTRYATFLRSSSTGGSKKAVAEYVEGKGWMDEDGNVVEVVTRNSKPRTNIAVVKSKKGKSEARDESDQSSTEESSSDEGEEPQTSRKSTSSKDKQQKLSAGTNNVASESSESSSTEASSEGSSAGVPVALPETTQAFEEDTKDSSSEISSSEEESKNDDADEKKEVTEQASPSSNSSSSDSDSSSASSSGSDSEDEETPREVPRPQSLAGPSGLSITIPSAQTSEVHPLEALYKRRKSDATNQNSDAVPSTFSFFGADTHDDDEEDSIPQVPLTPFTQRDFESRGLRSAAPTPDTSHANKRFLWPVEGDDGQDWTEDAGNSSPSRREGKEKEVKGDGEETEFQKWFYEHRGDANRAWKKRRKVVAKEKRQRENRKRGERP